MPLIKIHNVPTRQGFVVVEQGSEEETYWRTQVIEPKAEKSTPKPEVVVESETPKAAPKKTPTRKR